jgi:hypothetical protein
METTPTLCYTCNSSHLSLNYYLVFTIPYLASTETPLNISKTFRLLRVLRILRRLERALVCILGEQIHFPLVFFDAGVHGKLR